MNIKIISYNDLNANFINVSGSFTVTGASSYGSITIKYKNDGSTTIIFLNVDAVTLSANTFMNIKSNNIETLVQKLLAKVGLSSTSNVSFFGSAYVNFFCLQHNNGFVIQNAGAITNHYISGTIVL